MASLGTLALSGASGGQFVFEIYALGTGFKPLGAVYAVTRRVSNASGGYTHTIIYVGQTADLSERFEQHHKASCFASHSANCICVLVEANERRRLQIESDLVRLHIPVCNG